MKAFAILKDSIRESWDSKILLVLMIISLIFSLLMASIGYSPVPAIEVLQNSTNDFKFVILDRGNFSMGGGFGGPNVDVNFEIQDFKEQEPASNPANAVYTFRMVVTPQELKSEQELGLGRRRNRENDENKKEEPAPKKPAPIDTFGQLVAFWNVKSELLFKLMQNPSGEQQKELAKQLTDVVSSEKMEEFIKERFAYHYNFNIASVTRKEGPLKGPQEFTIVTAKSDPRDWPHYSSLFFGAIASKRFPPATSLGSVIFFIQNTLLNGLGAGVAIVMGVVVTSFYIPNMMRKGSIDLMLSKPLGRVTLLINKYLGGLSFMFIFSTVAVGSVWLVFGLRSGLWNPKFLLLILVWTYFFGILYSVSTLISVWTRNSIASLLITLAFYGCLWTWATTYNALEGFKKTPIQEQMPKWVNPTADAINSVLPRTRDLDVISTFLMADIMTENDQKRAGLSMITMPSLAGSFGVSFAWIAVLLGLASWRFAKKDY